MKIIIDGEKDLVWAEPGSKFGEIRQQLVDWLRKHGRTVLELVLDGQEMTLEESKKLDQHSVDKYQRLEVTTISPQELAVITLQELEKQLPGLSSSVNEVAAMLHRGEISAGLEKLQTCILGIETMLNTLRDAAQLVRIDLGSFTVQGKKVSQRLQKMAETLTEVRTATQSQDTVTLADLTEHELSPQLAHWQKVTHELAEYIIRTAESSSPPAGN